MLVTSLTHLIRNAAEALLESSLIKKKHIIIHARARPKDGVVIKVTDNGPGIDPQTLDDLRMFVPGKTTKPRCGTGFGLPTVQRYAEAHGGGLEIESEPGKGSIFTLTLPAKGGDDE